MAAPDLAPIIYGGLLAALAPITVALIGYLKDSRSSSVQSQDEKLREYIDRLREDNDKLRTQLDLKDSRINNLAAEIDARDTALLELKGKYQQLELKLGGKPP